MVSQKTHVLWNNFCAFLASNSFFLMWTKVIRALNALFSRKANILYLFEPNNFRAKLNILTPLEIGCMWLASGA